MPGGFSKRTSSAVCACAALRWQAPPAAAAMVAAAAMKPRRDAFGSSPSGDTDVCSLAMGVLLGDAGSGYYGTDARVPDVAQRVTHTIEDRNVEPHAGRRVTRPAACTA